MKRLLGYIALSPFILIWILADLAAIALPAIFVLSALHIYLW